MLHFPGSADRPMMVVLLGAVFLFCVSHYALNASSLKRWLPKLEHAWLGSKMINGALFALGSVLLALFGGQALDFAKTGLFDLLIGLGLAAVLALVLLPVLWVSAGKEEMKRSYPELRIRRSTKLIRRSAFAWILYLSGYELLFRGLILHAAVSQWGVWPGIAAMTALYVLAHLDKPAPETFGCFVAGPGFALLTLETGSVWPAVALHSFIAISTEHMAARNNPFLDAAPP